MQITKEELNPCTLKVSVVCDEAQVKDAFDKAFKQISKTVKLPGFRPGHAPKSMVQGLISKEDLYESAAETLVRNAYQQVVKEGGIEPDVTTRPSVDLTSLDQDANKAEMTLKIPLPPKIELGDYSGLTVSAKPDGVTESEVDRQIEEFRRRRQSREPVTDRGVQEGDVAVVNIKVESDAPEGRNFMTIAGQTFPGLDAALAGMKVEEIKSVELSFPENFQEKDWAGQTMQSQLMLTSLSTVKLPDLDDSFAQSLKIETVSELRERVRTGLVHAKESLRRDLDTEELLTEVHKRSSVCVSDNMWEQLAERRLRETAEEQKEKGKTLEEYATEQGMTLDALEAAWNEKAKLHVERALIIRELFVKEGMQLTNEDLTRELSDMAQEMETEPAELFEMLKKNSALDELQFRAISRKVADFLIASAERTSA